MEPESAESRGRDLMHGEWLCRQLRPMSSQDRAERTCEACQGRGRGGKFADDGAEDDEDEDEVPKDEDEVPRVRMCESCQGRGRFACSSSEDEVPKDEDEVLGPDPNEVQNDEPMDTEIDDGSSDGFDFGVGAVMDDSKEGIINIERGEEDDMIYRCAIYRCAIHEKRLNDLTMPQLRHLLDERGSTATGKWKEVLVDRCCDLGVTAAEIADAKKFKGKVRGLAVATPVRAPSTGFGSPATPPNTPPPAVAAPAVAPGTGDSSPVVTPGSAVSEGNSLTSVLMAPQSRVPGKCGFCSELVRIGLVNSLSCSDCPGASGEASGEHPQRNSNGFIATQVVIDVADSAQDSKRARIAGPDADALAEAGALHRAGWKFSV